MFTPREQDIFEVLKTCEHELQSMVTRKVVLTGCAGFLGRYFIEVIKKHNENFDKKIKLIGIDNLVSSGKSGEAVIAMKDAHIQLISHDMSKNTGNFTQHLTDADFFVHAAGIASPAHYKKKPLETIDIAVNGTRLLLDLARRGDASFTFFSSSEIYGNPPDSELPIKENYNGNVSCTGPRACYDESKRLGETLCSIYASEFGMNTRVIRPFNVYGPGMQETDYRVIPNFGFKLLRNEPVNVYGNGQQTRTYCYITDAMSGFIKVIVNGKIAQAYNVGNPNNEISARELAILFNSISSVNTDINTIDHPSDYPGDEPDRRCPDITKIMNLGYVPKVDIEDGLKRFWQFINAP